MSVGTGGIIFKQLLLRSRSSTALLRARHKISLLRAMLQREEELGCLVNDGMASRLITQMARPGSTFIDAGSHIGSVISQVQLHNGNINVVGIEPIPKKVACLRYSFPAAKIFECALGSQYQARVSFYVDPGNSALSSLSNNRPNRGKVDQIFVTVQRLDELDHFDKVDAIKFDVEGQELDAILGAEKTIKQNLPVILFESAPGGSCQKEQIWDLFNEWSYALFLPTRLAHSAQPLSKEMYLDGHEYPRISTNFFAVPLDRLSEFRTRAQEILGVTKPQ